MKLKSIISGLAVCLPMALACQAASTTTILDWEFGSSANPVTADSVSDPIKDPAGFNATAAINAPISQYYFNARPGGYGTERGLWDTLNAQITLTLSAEPQFANSAVDYSLKIDQFVGDPGFFPATNTVTSTQTLPAPASWTRQTLDATPANGVWVEDTFTWHLNMSPGNGKLNLTILPVTSGGGNGDLFIDRVEWDVTGTLMVPEPNTITLAAAGLLGLGLYGWRRQQSKA